MAIKIIWDAEIGKWYIVVDGVVMRSADGVRVETETAEGAALWLRLAGRL